MAELLLQTRKDLGKQPAKAVRRDGKVPGVYYYHGQQSIAFSVDKKNLAAVLQQESTLIDIVIDGKDKKKCIMRELQVNPVTLAPIHLDLMGIKLTEKIHITVPVHVTGTPAGVKEGGILNHFIRELEIECLPTDIPDIIQVDVSELEIGDSIGLTDLELENVRIIGDLDKTIATVTPPKILEEEEEEEEELLEGELEEGQEEPEVIKQGSEQDEE
jgi:large subunit ribosomal protein L25